MEGIVVGGPLRTTEAGPEGRNGHDNVESQCRNLLLALPAAIYTTDLEGRITLFNEDAAAMWGRRPEVGKDLWCGSWRIYRTDGSRLAHDECPMAVTLREGIGSRSQEIIVEREDGSRACVLANPEPIRDESGVMIGAVNMLVDITNRKEAEELIEDMNRSLEAKVVNRTAQLEAFCYSIAHDLRQHIRGVTFNAHLVTELVPTMDRDVKASLDRLEASAKKLDRMVSDLLRYARTSRQELKHEPVDLSALANEVSNQLLSSYPTAEVKVDDGLVTVGDEASLGVVLLNLIDNACKYASPERRPVIEVGWKDGVFHVRDNGEGFDMTYADRLFEPFQRLDPRSEIPGTGIGLASVKEIIEKHGGKVWADSEPGQGSTFFFKML